MSVWRVRKKIEGGKYETVFESRDRDDALSQFRAEYRLLLESSAHLTRETIESYMGSWDLQDSVMRGGQSNRYYYGYSRTVTRNHGGVYLRMYEATGQDAKLAVRPTRTEALDKILGIC